MMMIETVTIMDVRLDLVSLDIMIVLPDYKTLEQMSLWKNYSMIEIGLQ